MYASNAARFEQSVRNTLDQLRVRGRKDPRANIFQLLHDWLCDSRSRSWLLVLDNADDARVLLRKPSVRGQAGGSAANDPHEKTLLEYLPQCDHGRVIVTSRNKETAKELVDRKEIVVVEPMEEEQALALLRKKLETWYTEQYAPRLARELDFMPLALAQAAAYICQSDGRCSIQQYLVKLEQCDKSEASVMDMDKRDLRRDREASNSIMLTWQISFNHIREMRSSAAELLSLMSFFDRQAIPRFLLLKRRDGSLADEAERSQDAFAKETEVDTKDSRHAASTAFHDTGTDESATKLVQLEGDLDVLLDYSLIAITRDPEVFEMHRLVQSATKQWLSAHGWLAASSLQSIQTLDRAFPECRITSLVVCQSLFSHVLLVPETAARDRQGKLSKGSLLYKSGLYALKAGDLEAAERMTRLSSELRAETLGITHRDTLASMNALTLVYGHKGLYPEAKEVAEKVVRICHDTLEQDHLESLRSVSHLAMTYSYQGLYDEAEQLGIQVAKSCMRILAQDTLQDIHEIASTCLHQGNFEEFEEIERLIGTDISSANDEISVNSPPIIAPEGSSLVYRYQTLYSMVEVMAKRVIELSDAGSKEGIEDILTAQKHLAVAHRRQGHFADAEVLGLEIVERSRSLFGPENAFTLGCMNDLALAYACQGGGEQKAAQIFEEVIRISRRDSGWDVPDTFDTLTCMSNLFLVYAKRGRWEEAEQLGNEVKSRREILLGALHPSTLKTMSHLAFMCSQQRRWSEAMKLGEEVFNLRRITLGEDHPDTLKSKSNLASTNAQQLHWKEAERLGYEVLHTREKVFGELHQDTLASMDNLISMHRNQGKWQQAESFRMEMIERGRAHRPAEEYSRPGFDVTLLKARSMERVGEAASGGDGEEQRGARRRASRIL